MRASFHLVVCTGLALVTVALYGQTLDDEWHLDDRAELAWPGVREFRPDVNAAHYRGVVPLYVWALNYRISGEEPWSYHGTNLVIHLLNSVLVYGIGWILLGGRRGRFAAATGAALFCVHPLATQAVTYVTQRSTTLATAFLLGSLWAYLRYRTAGARWRGSFYGLALVCLWLGLHSKHFTLIVPVMIGSIELLGEPRPGRRLRWLLLVPFVGLALWRGASFLPRIVPAPPASPEISAETRGPAPSGKPERVEYFRTQIPVIARYLRLLVMPSGLNLDPDIALTRSWTEPRVVGSALLIGALLAAALAMRRRRPVTSLGVLLFLLAILPTSSVVPSPDLMFEHRVYPALLGFALVASDVVRALAVHGRLAWVVTGVALLTLASATYRRNQVWDTELSLWTDTVAKSPGKSRGWVNLALAHQNRNEVGKAERGYRRALELTPRHMIAMNNLGNLLRDRGDREEAERLYRAALAVAPGFVDPHINLGNLAMDAGVPAEAEAHYLAALRWAPESSLARYNLAKSLEAQGKHEAAIASYRRAVATRPGSALFLNDLGCAQLGAGRLEEAEATLREAIRANRSWAVAHYNLGLVLQERGARPEAAEAFAEAIRLEPGLEAPAPREGKRGRRGDPQR